jgi:hypothetical protein
LFTNDVNGPPGALDGKGRVENNYRKVRVLSILQARYDRRVKKKKKKKKKK